MVGKGNAHLYPCGFEKTLYFPGQEGATMMRGTHWCSSDMTISEVVQGLLFQAMARRAVPVR